jgi:RNA polymerase sigma-70 factor (ECF subfamily)
MMSRTFEKQRLADQKPDTALVDAAVSGDTDSFTELCRRYYPAMVAVAHSILGDRHLAEDAAQQAFAKAAVKLPQLKKRSKFASWIAAICRNISKDMARHAEGGFDPVQPLGLATERDHPAENVSATAAESDQDDVAEAVKQALGALPASAREVIFLRFYDGLSYEQISAVLGISEQAINGRLRRAKKAMAEHLRRRGFGEGRL